MNLKNKIHDLLDNFEEKNYKTTIFLVANLKKYTEQMSHYVIEHASDNEFFSLSEFEEIASSLLKIGLCLNVFYTEIDFIDYILKNYNRLNSSEILVYNLARDGKKEGKKSLIPSFCDYFGLNYTGSNALIVSLCRNKFIWSALSNFFEVKTPKTACYKNSTLLGNKFLSNKYIKKEPIESASINLSENSIIENFDWKNVNNEHFLIQEYIDGIEVEVPFFCIDNQYVILDPIKLDMHTDILTSEVSDNNDYSFKLFNDINLEKSLKETTKKLVQYIGIDTYGRVDFRIDKKGNFFVIDIATMPYTTKHSSFNFVMQYYGFSSTDLHKLVILSSL